MEREASATRREVDRTGRTSDDSDASGKSDRSRDRVASLHRATGNQAVKAGEVGTGRTTETVGRVGGDPVQAKLAVDDPDSPEERAAERVADAVSRSPAPGGPGRTGGGPAADGSCSRCRSRLHRGTALNCPECETHLQRAQTGGTLELDEETRRKVRSVRGGGRPLPARTRERFESQLGQGLADVRIHTGSRADAAARAVEARAFTVGRDVVFRSGEYRPGTSDGTRLLAHELTHVLQQRDGEESVQRQQPEIKQAARLKLQKAVAAEGKGTTEDFEAARESLEQQRSDLDSGQTREKKVYNEAIALAERRLANRSDSQLPECEVSMTFDGATLAVEKGGTTVERLTARSGIPEENERGKQFDYSVERQQRIRKGPIPEGTYWVKPDELDTTSLWTAEGWARETTFQDWKEGPWGSNRITVHPFDSTATFGRGGFFIHGGVMYQSAGCIDLAGEMPELADVLGQYSGCKVLLTVDYEDETVSAPGGGAAGS